MPSIELDDPTGVSGSGCGPSSVGRVLGYEGRYGDGETAPEESVSNVVLHVEGDDDETETAESFGLTSKPRKSTAAAAAAAAASTTAKATESSDPKAAPSTTDEGVALLVIGGKMEEKTGEAFVPPSISGLTDAEVDAKRLEFGFNEIKEVKPSKLKRFLSYFTGSISYLIEIAAILSAVLEDWTDFGVITALLVVNALIGYIEESRAEDAVDALKSSLALKAKAMRNGNLIELEARELVPGDIISLRLGDIIPADVELLGVNAAGQPTLNPLMVDQSALTGESLPVSKKGGDSGYSSAVVKQGQMMARVTAIAEKTFLGKAAHLISVTQDQGHFQKLISKIGNFLIAITLFMVLIILIVALSQKKNFVQQLQYALVLTIASIPVGLPTVLSVTMAVGAKQLAAKQVIVKRLTAVEQMAGMSILCSDKTGTLTLNELSVDEPYLAPGKTNEDLLLTAYLASESGTSDAIEKCVREEAERIVPKIRATATGAGDSSIEGYKILQFRPFDPVSKLTQATVLITEKDEQGLRFVAKGAPQVILNLCKDTNPAHGKAIATMAKRGLRALGVARSKVIPYDGSLTAPNFEKVEWELIGMLSLLDPPRPDSASTIRHCNSYGIDVKMITGDAILIAKEVCHRLGLFQNILNAHTIAEEHPGFSEDVAINSCERCDGFAQVVPEHKFRIVELLQKRGHLVGMCGDGVNDAPALKKADVGIAVHGCTDAARSAADIVLLAPGLSAIIDGVQTSRAIFQRMRSYAVYRITSTIHFLIFLFFAILCLGFSLPAELIVLIALLNDAATIVISVDNAQISKKPDKWRLGQLLSLSFILGIMLTASSFAHYFIARDVFNMNDDQLSTIIYLQMSSCPHFVIFSTRLASPFYTSAPSLSFFVAIVGTQIFAMFISIYGLITPAAIGWGWSVSIMVISTVYMMIMDFVKVQLYQWWNFERTAKLWPSKANCDKLTRRQQTVVKATRVSNNVSKVRKVVHAVGIAKMALKSFTPLPEAEPQMPVHSGHH